ncbi:hypothetical protein [Amycolatopsis sp. WQ 127309]|uniref:hypothetical protein n=1 Tax=Amycolatopsis sp. WQ 127309 TaxID=2932773 RepID=UPI001FF3AD7C|nr:hypothetical protein [Amycolatopsis sp. WQ 127309]UOZ10525.1 hypothetical protein MUY22_20580 [Amycolatopsis sp. WQ 127309]
MEKNPEIYVVIENDESPTATADTFAQHVIPELWREGYFVYRFETELFPSLNGDEIEGAAVTVELGFDRFEHGTDPWERVREIFTDHTNCHCPAMKVLATETSGN